MNISAAAVRGLLSLPDAVLRAIAGERVVIDGQRLDLQSQVVQKLTQLVDSRPTETLTVADARRRMEGSSKFAPARPPLASVHDRTIELDGRTLAARVYTPDGIGVAAPATVYLHGGGWVIGSIRAYDHLCSELAHRVGCVVVSVDYRLAPEHRFPAAADDAIASFRWVRDHHDALGIDPARIAVAGDSAGGNLAAVVAQALRADGPAYQLLIYPVVDLVNETPAYALFREGFLLTTPAMRWFIDHYVPDQGQRGDPRVSPLLAADLRLVAPACVLVAGYDPLRDEGIAYAERLREVGALDELIVEPGLMHGFASMTYLVRAASRSMDQAFAALRGGLTSSRARSPG